MKYECCIDRCGYDGGVGDEESEQQRRGFIPPHLLRYVCIRSRVHIGIMKRLFSIMKSLWHVDMAALHLLVLPFVACGVDMVDQAMVACKTNYLHHITVEYCDHEALLSLMSE